MGLKLMADADDDRDSPSMHGHARGRAAGRSQPPGDVLRGTMCGAGSGACVTPFAVDIDGIGLY